MKRSLPPPTPCAISLIDLVRAHSESAELSLSSDSESHSGGEEESSSSSSSSSSNAGDHGILKFLRRKRSVRDYTPSHSPPSSPSAAGSIPIPSRQYWRYLDLADDHYAEYYLGVDHLTPAEREAQHQRIIANPRLLQELPHTRADPGPDAVIERFQCVCIFNQ